VRRRPAYTLLELVLVIALLGILTALAYPSLDSMYGYYQLTAAADMVRAGWASARGRALDEGRPYRFAVVPNKGNFRVAPDSPDFWSGGDPPPPPDGSRPPLILSDTLPKGIRFATPDAPAETDQSGDSSLPTDGVDSGSWSRPVVFLPDGTARDDAEIVFQARGARPILLKLRALTGAVTVKPFKPEEDRR